jgi:hypothetical protein
LADSFSPTLLVKMAARFPMAKKAIHRFFIRTSPG